MDTDMDTDMELGLGSWTVNLDMGLRHGIWNADTDIPMIKCNGVTLLLRN
jgi:hypothetical protein